MDAVWVLLKYLAEAAWCLVLVRQARSKETIRKAMSLGFVRLLIGREAMLLITKTVVLPVSELLVYGVLLAGRWFAWGLLVHIASRPPAPRTMEAASERARRGWQIGGVFVSCLADVPALLSGTWAGLLWL